jgi:hypothetical protein
MAALAQQQSIPWHARSDGNHWPLAERLRASLDGTALFDARIARVDDLNGLPGRAAGGKPVQRFKLRELARIASEASTPFVWSDVDVQPLGSLQRLHDAITDALRTDDDLYVQREFADCGCNVGFLIVRPSPRLDAFLENWLRDLEASNTLDQKILNRYLLDDAVSVKVRRLPTTFWASSSAPPLLHELVLHHANFVIDNERRPSSDPAPKLAQLDAVRRCFDEKDAAAFGTLAGSIAGDASLAKYRERHFPDPEAWAALP